MARYVIASRRDLLRVAGMAGVGLLIGGPPVFGAASAENAAPGVSPTEDLMREHGALDRILLIYEEALRRLRNGEVKPDVPATCADLVRRFIEDYHEKLEEDHLFPLFRKAGRLTDLVDVLLAQHKAGRVITDQITANAQSINAQDREERAKTSRPIREFIRMYRPHAAREDTVLFPALHDLLAEKEFDEMGDKFEDREHELFGAKGFDGIVDQIAAIEKSLGIYELSSFTPGGPEQSR